MPEATLAAVAEHGVVRGDTIRPGYRDAAELMTRLAEIGIVYDDVVDKLERESLAAFQASWAALTSALSSQRDGRSSQPADSSSSCPSPRRSSRLMTSPGHLA
jgi:transaldolase